VTVKIDDLTLLILAHNNPAYLARSVDYYARLDCEKIIVDSSTSPTYAPDRVPDGYDYCHLPLDYFTKLRSVAATISNPHVLCAGCDDFFVPESVQQATAYLRDHPTHVAVNGHHIGFRAAGHQYAFFLKHSQEFLHLAARGANENVFARLNLAITPPYGLIYSVVRSAVFKDIIATPYTNAAKIHYYTFYDRYIQILLAIMGDVKMLPALFAARSVTARPQTASTAHTQFRDAMTHWPQGAMDEYVRMLISLATLLQRERGVPLNEGMSLIDGVLRRSMWSQMSWNRDDPAQLAEIGRRADEIDARLSQNGGLLVPRRDRFGMPFPEAERLFPVYANPEYVREIAACLERHPVETTEP